jgi:hypothetical protein
MRSTGHANVRLFVEPCARSRLESLENCLPVNRTRLSRSEEACRQMHRRKECVAPLTSKLHQRREITGRTRQEGRAFGESDLGRCGALIQFARWLLDALLHPRKSPGPEVERTYRHDLRRPQQDCTGTFLQAPRTADLDWRADLSPRCSSCSGAYHYGGSMQAGSTRFSQSAPGAGGQTAGPTWPATRWQ